MSQSRGPLASALLFQHGLESWADNPSNTLGEVAREELKNRHGSVVTGKPALSLSLASRDPGPAVALQITKGSLIGPKCWTRWSQAGQANGGLAPPNRMTMRRQNPPPFIDATPPPLTCSCPARLVSL